MHKVTSRWQHQDTIKIEWNLGKRCNLDCTYCPAIIHDNHSPHTDIEILKNTVKILNSLNKPVRLSLTGGEPSVHPCIEELLKSIKDAENIIWLSMTTNATRKSEWYLEQSKYIDQYVFSLHFEQKDWKRSLSNILDYEMERTNKVLVHIMAHHKYMDEVKYAEYDLRQVEIPHVIRRIRWTEGNHDLFDDMRYQADDLQWIREVSATAEPNCIIDDKDLLHANDIIKNHMNQFNGWKCNAGIESLMINWDGEVYRATCRVGETLGNIYNDDFNAVNDSVICTRKWCTCEADIPITKVKL